MTNNLTHLENITCNLLIAEVCDLQEHEGNLELQRLEAMLLITNDLKNVLDRLIDNAKVLPADPT